MEVVRRETVSWRQKAKVKWAKDEDGNAAYFHRVANGRTKKKFYWFSGKQCGCTSAEDKEIEETQFFYSLLYGWWIGPKPFLEGLDWYPISLSDRSVLGSSITKPLGIEQIRWRI